MTTWVKLEVGARGMNEMKSLFDKNKCDPSIYTLSHTYIYYTYIYRYVHTFYLSTSLTILSLTNNFVHLEFHLLLLISTSAVTGYQNKGSNSICTNKYPGQR